MKGAGQAGPVACAANEHEVWLADLHHWRNERRIRIGNDGSRYDPLGFRCARDAE